MPSSLHDHRREPAVTSALRVGLVIPVRSAREVREFAVGVEGAGFWGVGVPDTSPFLYQGAYPTITAALGATERLHVGTYMTNPVTRHWSVHAANARALDDLFPSRFFIGMSTGDGAVRAIGLRPARWAELAECVQNLRGMLDDTVPIAIAASGPRGTAVAAEHGDVVVFSQGLDVVALRDAIAAAAETRSRAGMKKPMQAWASAQVCVTAPGASITASRAALRGFAYGVSHYRFSQTLDGKNVPARWKELIGERFEKYDYAFHGKSGDNPNATLFEDHPEVEDYLIDRAIIVGSAAECATRVQSLANELQLDGVWLNPVSPDGATGVPRVILDELGAALSDVMVT
jgi:alkanesulfonate monooxygenase SsuD/methylene tetrahydromethanopterin reductase-like flavin-dependent oxidoreductase (luciferase family)